MGHHFVPQRYLRKFQDETNPGHIWLHVKGAAAPKLVPIKAVAQARNFYRGDVEHRLDREIERPGSSAIEKLICGEDISAEERLNATQYIGTMLMRVPTRRRRSQKLFPEVLEETVEKFHREIASMRREGLLDEARAALTTAQIELVATRYREAIPPIIEEKIRSPFASAMVQTALHHMKWRICHYGRPIIITSDNPVFFDESLGLANPESELSFPLSSSTVLHGSWQGEPIAIEHIQATAKSAREFNSRTFSGSEKLRLSSTPQDWLLSPRNLRRPIRAIPWDA